MSRDMRAEVALDAAIRAMRMEAADHRQQARESECAERYRHDSIAEALERNGRALAPPIRALREALAAASPSSTEPAE